MSKPFYSDYVRHMMRFYSRNPNPLQSFKSDVDKENWIACNQSIRSYSTKEKHILIYVYGGYDTLPDNVYEMAKKHHINQNVIWDMMKDFEHKLAKQRNLI